MPQIAVRKRHECEESQLVRLIDLADKGGEVDRHFLESGIRERARDILWMEDERLIVAMAVLKNPNAEYWTGVFEKSKAHAKAEDYPLELGYIYVEEALRGRDIGSKLVARALAEASGKGVFATTREDNRGMLRILEKFGFSRDGQPYWSKRQNCNLVLCIHSKDTA